MEPSHDERSSSYRESRSRARERSRSRSRSRSHSRGDHQERERDSRGDHQERERDSRGDHQERERDSRRRRYSRSRSRERASRWERDEHYGRRSDERSRESRDRRDDWSRDRGGGEDPTVIMLRNMRESVVKEDVAKAVGDDISYVKDIRLVSRKGTSSFAFVEFYEAKDAARWMEKILAVPLYLCGARVDVDYSRAQRDQWRDRHHDSRDWVCFKCNTMNFARRRFCMTCDCSRSESDQLHEDVRSGRSVDRMEEDNAPSKVLILKGLDALSTEGTVRVAVSGLRCSQQPRDVRLIRDHITNTSRGFCFLEFNTTEDATAVLHKILEQKPAFFVDGKRIMATYARGNVVRGPTHKVASAAIAQAQWSMSQAPTNSSEGQQQSHFNSQPADQRQQLSARSSQPAPPATPYQQDQSVHPAYQPAVSAQTQSATTTSSTPASQPLSPGQSDLPSTYSFDPTSGFYFDSSTGLYYDPKTQYHYNSQTGNYCYFDSTQQAYISVNSEGNPVQSSTATTTATTETATTTPSAEPKKSVGTTVQTPKNAKKIARDMERWAKNLNAAKTTQKQQLQALIQLERAEVVARVTEQQQQQPLPATPVSAVKRSGISLSAALEQENASEKAALNTHAADVSDVPTQRSLPAPLPVGADPADPDFSHTDWAQLACLLCKRKFKSKEVLVKHQQFSDLHKQNLEKLKKPSPAPPSAVKPPATDPAPQPHVPAPEIESQDELVYRDRAKERRDKYGTPAIIPGWKKRLEREIGKASYSTTYEQPTVEGLKDDNLGNKMLQAMGWNEGQGLGKANQGIVEPIKAHMRQVGAGLGASGSSHGLYSSAGTYRETLRQLTKSRYDNFFQE